MPASRAVIFSTGSRIGALPTSHVEEVMRPLCIEPFPRAEHFVEGIALIRGEPTAVLNLEALFGAHPGRVDRLISIRVEGRSIALGVMSVIGLWDLRELDTHEVPPLLESALPDAIEAVGRLDGQLLLVLRAGRLVPEAVWAELDVCGSSQ